MSLVHHCAIVSADSKEKYISTDMEFVTISDDLMLYISDSLKWINTIWPGNHVKNGIPYYGYSIIEDAELEKLKSILKQWKALFMLAPPKIKLTGLFLIDENRYEKLFVDREAWINELNLWIELCEKANRKNAKILYNGI